MAVSIIFHNSSIISIMNSIHSLTIFGLVLIALGTFFTIYGQQKLNDKTSDKLNNKADKIEKLSEENIELMREVNKLNTRISDSITGGDSYCYFVPRPPSSRSNIVDLQLVNEGINPIYDISIKIDDVEKMFEIIEEDFRNCVDTNRSFTESSARMSPSNRLIDVGNLSPSIMLNLHEGLEIPHDVDRKSYNIIITSRNGQVDQLLRYRKVHGNWAMAMQVTRGGEVLKKYVDRNYPKNEKGEVDW